MEREVEHNPTQVLPLEDLGDINASTADSHQPSFGNRTLALLGMGATVAALSLGVGAQPADARVVNCGPNTPPANLPDLKQGDTGKCVWYGQRLLQKHKDLKSTEVDGAFGANTRGKVTGFQVSNNIYGGSQLGTGTIGPKTWAKLRNKTSNQGIPKVCKDSPGYAVCTSLNQGVTRVLKDGKVVKGFPSSYGQFNTANYRTDEGVHRVLWKVYYDTSRAFGNAPMPRATYYTQGGEAFHVGSLAVVSHGCIHLNKPAAEYIYNKVPSGSLVANY